MDEQSPQAGTPVYQESQQKNAKWLWFLIILIIIAALVFAFVRGIGPFAQFKGQQEEASPTPFEFSASPASEASPQVQVDKSEAKIRVLNGSGTAGVASSVKDFLEQKGYKVAEIGNADNFDFEQTVLRFKEGFEKFREVLTSDLSDDYSVTSSSESLEATDSADIEITVGAK